MNRIVHKTCQKWEYWCFNGSQYIEVTIGIRNILETYIYFLLAGQSGFGISCCRSGRVIEPSLRHPDCFAIELPRNDHVFARFGEQCMEFVRSLPAPRPECNFGPREQVNRSTDFPRKGWSLSRCSCLLKKVKIIDESNHRFSRWVISVCVKFRCSTKITFITRRQT